MTQGTLHRPSTAKAARTPTAPDASPWRLKGCLRCGGDQRRAQEGWVCLQCGRETPFAASDQVRREEVA